MQDKPIQNIGFIATRIAGTDGVSLEIEKWDHVLRRSGFCCFYFAGEVDHDEEISLAVELAHFEHPQIQAINERLFGTTKRSRQITDEVHVVKELLKSKLYEFCDRFKVDLLIPENALTIPMNVPLGLAITEFIAETGMPTIAHHHDFYWERDRFLINGCQDFLDQAFPPNLPSIRHIVINSLASKELSYRLGIADTIIPNVYDFANEPNDQGYACQLREEIRFGPNDLFILQPTRVVPRKWIERSVEVVHHLKLSNPSLVISHAFGDEGEDYYHNLVDYAENMGVRIILIDHLIGSPNGRKPKKYTLADVYKCADLVLYPSLQEGFGNAFLEAIYYKKPILVNRYSIFVTDIEPKAFDVIKIDGNISGKTIEKIRQVLEDEVYRTQMVGKNYELARKYFSFEVLEKKLLYTINTFDQ